MAERQKNLQAFVVPSSPQFQSWFLGSLLTKTLMQGEEGPKKWVFISNDSFATIYDKDCLNSEKKDLNREVPYIKITKYEKSKWILLQFASCYFNLHMANIASREIKRKFTLTSIKMRKLSCIFIQHQNKLSDREKD